MYHCSRSFLLSIVSFALICCASGAALADVGICLGNGTYKVYKTEKTCADLTIGPIIRSCADLGIANPGGGTGLGNDPIILGLHPALDGQPIVGIVPFSGAAISTDGEAVSDFVITRALSGAGDQMQVLAFDSTGNIYRAFVTATGSDSTGEGDVIISAAESAGSLKVGQVVITIDIVDPSDYDNILASHDTPLDLNLLNYEYFDGAVAVDNVTWGSMKTLYR